MTNIETLKQDNLTVRNEKVTSRWTIIFLNKQLRILAITQIGYILHKNLYFNWLNFDNLNVINIKDISIERNKKNE